MRVVVRPSLEQLSRRSQAGTIQKMISYGRRLKYAFRAFFSILDYSRIPDDIAAALVKPEPQAPQAAPAPPAAAPVLAEGPDRAMQILALLQRDGRLIDFLMEDIARYADAQIGAAVRDVHAGCGQTLRRYFTLQPVLDVEEGAAVTVEQGTDPGRVKVVGNTTGAPPVRGVVRHRGWESVRIELPPLPVSSRTVIAPAEVEVV
jgi:hypothetical protein